MDGKPQSRISTVAAIVLFGLAFIVDLIGLIPFASYVVTPVFWIGSFIFFYFKKISIVDAKKLGSMAISWVISLVPFLQMVPLEVVSGIAAVIAFTWLEDKAGISTKALKSGKVFSGKLNQGGRREPPKREPLNQEEQRLPESAEYQNV